MGGSGKHFNSPPSASLHQQQPTPKLTSPVAGNSGLKNLLDSMGSPSSLANAGAMGALDGNLLNKYKHGA